MAKKPDVSNFDIMEDERARMAQAGLMWLYELELVNSSTLQNNLYGNLYSFPHVSDVELLIDRHQRKMLIWIQFDWFTRKFLKARRKRLKIEMLDQLQSLLPSFEFRIVEDRAIFDLALRRMEEVLFGGKSVVKTNESEDHKSIVGIRSPVLPDASSPISSNDINFLPSSVGGPAPEGQPGDGDEADPDSEGSSKTSGEDPRQ